MTEYAKIQSPGNNPVDANVPADASGNITLLDVIRTRLVAHLSGQLDAARQELATLPSYAV
jgi:hypothetical protein